MKSLLVFLSSLLLIVLSLPAKAQYINQNPVGVRNKCPGSTVLFIVVASPANGGDITFQWQYSTDNGATFTDATNNDGYHSWSETGYYDSYDDQYYDTLIITNIPASFQKRIYRCVVTEQYQDPTDPTTIDITTANSDTCLLGLDTVPPSVTVKTFVAYLDSTGKYIFSPGDVVSLTSDNCTPENQIKITLTPNAVYCADTGTIYVTVQATDSVGNDTNKSAQVIVMDTIRPDFDYYTTSDTNPFLLFLDSSGTCTIYSDTLSLKNVWDNCAIKDTVFVSPSGIEYQEVEFNCKLVNVTTRGWIKLIDSSNNAKLKPICFKILDTIKPYVTPIGTASSPQVIPLDQQGEAKITPLDVLTSAWDNCSLTDTSFIVNGSPVDTLSFDCSQVGDTNVVIRVYDNSGNYRDFTAYLTIADTSLPYLQCHDYIRQADASGNYTVDTTEFDAIASDNCGISSLTNDYNNSSTLAGTVLPTGTYTITWTATDVHNNTRTCISKIDITTATYVSALNRKISVYPNPSSNSITIDLGQKNYAELQIISMTGKILKKATLNKQISKINISQLPTGTYIIRIKTTDKTYNFKIIK